jgi:L-ascorbate metabolism protein UlaG (beta-lactamase superfamily)
VAISITASIRAAPGSTIINHKGDLNMAQTITWIGHGSWKLTTSAGVKIYLDPFIQGNPAAAIKLEEAYDADIVAVTHGHSDHLGDAIDIVTRTDCDLVTLADLYAYLELHGIPNDKNGGAVQQGGSTVLRGVRFYCVYACHSGDIWGPEYAAEKKLMPGSGSCGFVVAAPGDKPVYFAGDTGVFGDMRLIAELYHPAVSVLPVCGKFTMGIKEANMAARFLESEVVIPGHYNTFPAIQRTKEELEGIVKGLDSQLKIMTPGESFVFNNMGGE